MYTHPISRIAYTFMLVLLGCTAPLFITLVFAVAGVMVMRNYVEGVIVVMVVEYLGRGGVWGGVFGWGLLLVLILVESYRARLSFSGE